MEAVVTLCSTNKFFEADFAYTTLFRRNKLIFSIMTLNVYISIAATFHYSSHEHYEISLLFPDRFVFLFQSFR